MVRDGLESFKENGPKNCCKSATRVYAGRVNAGANGIEAFICHPQFGNEMVRGVFYLGRDALRFESPQCAPFLLPHAVAVVELGDDENWITLTDQREPELKFFVARTILEDDRFVRVTSIRQQLEKVLNRREWFGRIKVTALSLLGFALLAWVISFAAGWGVRVAVKGISVQHELEFGEEAFRKIEPHLVFVNDSNVVRQLTALAAPLLPVVPVRGIPLQFYVARGAPNAFALPGGRIVVTTGLLGLLDRPEELLGVLAHESAHVAQRHAFQHMIAGKGPVYLLQILSGGNGKAVNLMAFPSELLVYESFSQKYEREADAYGWDYLVAARINPHGLIDALKKLKQSSAEEAGSSRGLAFDSHPDLDKRIRWLEAKWAALPDKDHFIELTNTVPKVPEEKPSLDKLLKMFSGDRFR